MSKRRGPQSLPRFLPARYREQVAHPPGLLELDRFSTADIERWNARSKDLDQLAAVLYSGLEPQRQRYHDDLIAALQAVPAAVIDFTGWFRVVDVRYNETPLAAYGNLRGIGGRFNVGAAIDNAIGAPWPALYIASDFETAFREKFGLAKGSNVDGLTAGELALRPGSSFSAFQVNGHLGLVLDLTRPGALEPIAKVLTKFSLPDEATRLGRRLKIPPSKLSMIRTPKNLMRVLLEVNWRMVPIQFGNPSSSQIFGGWAVEAGFEAIRYKSTKGDGTCVAVFPHRLASDASFMALSDASAHSVQHTRLDMTTADKLCGWEALPPSLRP